MQCAHCRADMKKGTAPYHIDRNGYHLQWDHVAAWVCTQCGEAHFEEKEVREIQGAIAEMDRHARNLSIAA